MPTAVPQQCFGRYTVVAELGRGAMATVYRAVDSALEREVAVKALLPNLPDDVMTDVRERFLREAKAAGRLGHPNIVTIFDVGEQDGVAYIAMELLEGRTLQRILREDERLPFPQIAEIAAQIADALEHAHRAGVVHRDVKPANVVVSPSGRAKLADFGIAHVASSSLTQTGSSLGSPKYMSPEQVLGQPIDPRSDIFSLGVVLYEMLVGRTPFERPGEPSVFPMLQRIPVEPHATASNVDPAVPSLFDQILARALAKTPSQRYQSAAEMAAALREDCASQDASKRTPALAKSPQAPPPSEVERTTVELIADMDKFAVTFEARQLAQLRAEEAERIHKEEELERWAQAEVKRREEFERQRDAHADRQTAHRHAKAIERLREQAAQRTVSDDGPRRAGAAIKLDARLRVAFRYLSEFAAELNRAQPVSDRPYNLLYLGEVKGVILGDGFTDYRSRDLEGRDRIDFVKFKYKARCPQPVAVEVSGRQLRQTLDRLSALRIPYKCTDYKKNDFGAVVRATLAMSGPFSCQATVRGDYEEGGFVIELANVRRYGVDRVRFGLEDFTDQVLDELGSYILGIDDVFARRIPARS